MRGYLVTGSFDGVLAHVGHYLHCVYYGKSKKEARNAAITCEDCGMVIVDFDLDNPTPERRSKNMVHLLHEHNVHKLEGEEKYPYWFEAAMVDSFSPIFDSCSDNHDVEDRLRRAKVLLPSNKTDTESCALVCLFSKKASYLSFMKRFNAYIERLCHDLDIPLPEHQ